MNINLNLYKYFYSVAKNLSFTKAAEELMISQPSLSYSVKVLEDQLNKKLFERTSKGIGLTREGKELYDRVVPIIESLDSICENDDNNMSGKITIGLRSFYAQKFFPVKMRLIHLLFPEIEIDLKIRKSEELIELLENDEVDIILDDTERNTNKIESQIIKDEERAYTTFFTSSERNIDKITEEIIKNEKIVVVKSNKFIHDALEKYPDINVENVNSTPDMIEEVKLKNKIGLSSTVLLEDYFKMGLIKFIDSDYEFPKMRKFNVTYKKNCNKKIRNIINAIKDYNSIEAEEALKNNN